jgi:hypothetical protein
LRYVGHPFIGTIGRVTADVWVLDSSELSWTPLETTGGGPAGIAYEPGVADPARDRMIVLDLDATAPEPTVWTLPFVPPHEWRSPLVANDGPGRRLGSVAVYDPAGDRVLVFGGRDRGSYEPLGDLWELALTPSMRWRKIEAWGGVAPSPRAGAAFVYDPARRAAFLVGGDTGPPGSRQLLDDTWQLVLEPEPRWVPIDPRGAVPPARAYAQAAYDPQHERVVVYSGMSRTGFHNDTWALDVEADGAPVWRFLLYEGTPPLPRAFGSMTWLPARESFAVFGGISGALDQGDLWELSTTGVLPKPSSSVLGAATVRPSPTTGPAHIEFTTGAAGSVRVSVHDLRGRRVRAYAIAHAPAGRQSVLWDGRDEAGIEASPGVYFVRIEASGVQSERRVVRLASGEVR